MTRRIGLNSVLALVLGAGASLVSTGCSNSSSRNAPLQYAFVGPASASLRDELALPASQVSTVKHGERVEIIDTRRRLVKVRTTAEKEGWIDSNLLLTTQQMDELNRIRELAAKLPVQGKATVGDQLNVHTGPSRPSPMLFQIPENSAVEVLAHRSSPRTAENSQVASALRPAKKAKASGDGKPQKASSKQPPVPVLPLPQPPPPPLNWERLSVPRSEDVAKGNAQENAGPPPDDWSLVRIPAGQPGGGQVGWALSRMLSMSVPDDVIRYTDGRRITAYLDLGEVADEGRMKHNWIWTTISTRGTAFDFDSFRVLVWNPGKHRYETARVERNLAGFYPLEDVQPTPAKLAAANGKTERSQMDERRFSLVVADQESGRIYRKVYALTGRRVRLVSTEAAAPPAQPTSYTRSAYDPLASPQAEKGWWDSTVDWVKGFGKKSATAF